MSPKPWYHKGLRFECTRCGNCCTSHGDYAYVYLMPPEVEALAAHLHLETQGFLDRYCQRDEGHTILRMDAPACPFLSEARQCSVYEVRPKQCRTWPFWEENLEPENWEGPVRDCCPGIGKGRLYTPEEIERSASETEAWYEG